MGFVKKHTALRNRTGYYYKGLEIALTNDHLPGHSNRMTRTNTHWRNDNEKIEAAALYAVVKSWEKVKEITKIPVYVLKKWSLEPWWLNVVEQVKKEKNEALDAKITEVLDISLDAIEDRIKHGEYIYDRRTKEFARIPIRAKDIAIVADVIFDKRQLIRGEVTSRTESKTESQKLENLKEKFESLARSKQINPVVEPIEGVIIDSEGEVHELSKGSNEGQAGAKPQNPDSALERTSEVQQDGVSGNERPSVG